MSMSHSCRRANLTQLTNWMFYLQIFVRQQNDSSLVFSRLLCVVLPPSEAVCAGVCMCEINPEAQINVFHVSLAVACGLTASFPQVRILIGRFVCWFVLKINPILFIFCWYSRAFYIFQHWFTCLPKEYLNQTRAKGLYKSYWTR